MSEDLTKSKQHLDFIERQRTFRQDVKRMLDLVWRAITEAEAEGVRLEQQAQWLEEAEQRGEPPNTEEATRIQAAQAAIVERLGKLGARIQDLSQQAEAVTQAANAVAFEACRRQFNAQFNAGDQL